MDAAMIKEKLMSRVEWTTKKIISSREPLLWVRFFGIIQIRRIKETEKSLPRVDSSVPLMRHDPSDLGSLILNLDQPKGTHPLILMEFETSVSFQNQSQTFVEKKYNTIL